MSTTALAPTATITFVDSASRISDPIPVPRWSKITLTTHPDQPVIFMGTDKVVLYSGPYQVNGKGFEAPRMRSLPHQTRVMSPITHLQPRPRPKRRSREVTLPAWLLWMMVGGLYILFGTTLWFAIP